MTKIKATPAKPSRSKKTVEEEAEVEEEITPPKAKGKGILGALSGRLKRKQGDTVAHKPVPLFGCLG